MYKFLICQSRRPGSVFKMIFLRVFPKITRSCTNRNFVLPSQINSQKGHSFTTVYFCQWTISFVFHHRQYFLRKASVTCLIIPFAALNAHIYFAQASHTGNTILMIPIVLSSKSKLNYCKATDWKLNTNLTNTNMADTCKIQQV